jgi:hypothetical protein
VFSGQLVALNESWARKTTQLTESEEACKQKGRELEAAYKQKEKELDEAYKRKADRLEARIAEKEGELSFQIEMAGKKSSILETATVEQVAKKAEVERQLFEKDEKIEELAREVKEKDDAASTQFSGLEAIIADQAAKAAEIEKRFVEKSKKIEELEKKEEERTETLRTQLSTLGTATAELTQKKAETEKQFSEKNAKIQDLEKEAKEWAETLRTQLSILGTVTAELAQKKAEMEKQFSEKNAKIRELERSEAEVEKKLAEKDAEISELRALKDRQEGEAHALRASMDAYRVVVEKELRTEFEEEKDQWRNSFEDEFAGSRDKELLRLEKVAGEVQGFMAPAKVMMANGEKVGEGLKSLRTAIDDYQTSIRHIEARADRLEEECVEGAAQVQEEFGEISEQSVLLARRVEEFSQHVRAMNQRILEPDRREREVNNESGTRAGLGGKRGREYSADEGPVSKRRRSRGSSQSSFTSLGSAVGGSVENVYRHGIDLDEEEAEESTLVALQVNDREPSDAEEDDSVAGEDQEPGELRKRIDTSFAEMCGSVGFPEGWSLRRRVAFFDGLFEKEEEIHQKAAVSKKKGKKPIGEFGPTTTSWVELFDKGVKGSPRTHGGGSRICFMALNGRLGAKFPVQVVDGSEVPENRRVLYATHKDSTLGDGQECVFVECASGKNLESDWRGGVK